MDGICLPVFLSLCSQKCLMAVKLAVRTAISVFCAIHFTLRTPFGGHSLVILFPQKRTRQPGWKPGCLVDEAIGVFTGYGRSTHSLYLGQMTAGERQCGGVSLGCMAHGAAVPIWIDLPPKTIFLSPFQCWHVAQHFLLGLMVDAIVHYSS